MSKRYTILHVVATLLGVAALAYQTLVVWQAFNGSTDAERLGIPLATTSAALLPVIAEAAWRTRQRIKAILLFASVAALVAFIVPSGISRMGEGADAKVAGAAKADQMMVQLTLDRDSAAKSVEDADKALASECRTGKGARCEGLRLVRAEALALRDATDQKIASHAFVATPWLPSWHPALLPIGMEMAIWSCLWFGFAPLTHPRAAKRAVAVKARRKRMSRPRPPHKPHLRVVAN